MYLLLAGCLFPEVGYLGVWRKLTAGLDGIATATPAGSAFGTGPPPGRTRAAAVAVRPAPTTAALLLAATITLAR